MNTIVIIFSALLLHKYYDLRSVWKMPVYIYFYVLIFGFSGLLYAEYYEGLGLYIAPMTESFIRMGFVSFTIGLVMPKLLNFYRANSNTRFNHQMSSPSIYTFKYEVVFYFGLFFSVAFIAFSGFNSFTAIEIDETRATASAGKGFLKICAITCFMFSLGMDRRRSFYYFLKVGIAMIAMASFGHRAPLLKLILVLVLTKQLFVSRMSMWRISVLGLLLFLILVVLGAIRAGGFSDFESFKNVAMARIGWRPFVTIYNFDRLYNSFDHSAPLYGYTFIRDFSVLLPGRQLNTINWISAHIGANNMLSSTILLSGLAYLDFKVPGIILYNLLAGIAISLVYEKWFSPRQVNLRVRTLGVLNTITLAGVGIVGFTSPVLYGVVPYLFLYLITKKIR